MKAYLATDLAAQGLERWRWYYAISRRVSYYQHLYRRHEYWLNCRRDPIGRVMEVWLHLRVNFLGERLGFTIPPNVFERGLSIAHPGTIVVNQGVRVGTYCRIHQGVTLGQVRGQNPVLGDRVFLGANACVVGGARIGDDVAVGAGAVVTNNVPSGVTVVGVPARIVSQAGSRGLLKGLVVGGVAQSDHPTAHGES